MRDIIDDVVYKNRNIDFDVYESAKEDPKYFGQCREYEKVLSWNNPKLEKAGLFSITDQLINGLNISEKDAYINYPDGMKLKVPVAIVKLIKCLVYQSSSPSESMAKVIADYIRAITNDPYKGYLSVFQYDDKVSQVLADELSEYLKDYYAKNNIDKPMVESFDSYSSIIESLS